MTFYSGDSYTSTFFNSSKAEPTPGGNPLGNPTYPGVTSAGFGQPNWVDNLILDYSPTNTLCYDFAFYGASVERHPLDAPIPGYYAFVDQVPEFQKTLSNVSWADHDHVMISWFGINDAAIPTAQHVNSPDPIAVYAEITTTYFALLDTLYDQRARNFVVITVPRKSSIIKISHMIVQAHLNLVAFDRAPLAFIQGPEDVANIKSNVTAFNNALIRKAQAFQSNHSDAHISIFDSAPPWNNVIDNPQQNGVDNATCEDSSGTACLWSNSAHPATAIQRAWGTAFHNNLNNLGFYDGHFNSTPIQNPPADETASQKSWAPAAPGPLSYGTIVVMIAAIVVVTWIKGFP